MPHARHSKSQLLVIVVNIIVTVVQDDRLDIMKILSKNLDFDDDVNLEQIAEQADYFSGADLQSLLYSAQLASMKLTDDVS